MRFTEDAGEEVPVLIAGGGGAGLTASMLLARQGVEHLLVSARPGTSDLPKAHVLNQRAMEILEDAGVADAIAGRSTPAGQMKRLVSAVYCGTSKSSGPSALCAPAIVGKAPSWSRAYIPSERCNCAMRCAQPAFAFISYPRDPGPK